MIYLILIAGGCAALFFAYKDYNKKVSFLSACRQTSATTEIITSQNERTMYAKVYKFTTKDRKEISVQSKMWSSIKPAEQTGISIVYDALNPNDMLILSYWGIFATAVILSIFGVCLLGIGIGYYLSPQILQ